VTSEGTSCRMAGRFRQVVARHQEFLQGDRDGKSAAGGPRTRPGLSRAARVGLPGGLDESLRETLPQRALPMTPLHTRQQLADDLRRLGLREGCLVFLHSSFRSLGPVEGGAGAVVGALEDAVGREGLILMPSFHLVERARRAETWDPETTPSTVGWLTEFFRRMPGTLRSDHYSHSVAARGKGAAEFVAGHRRREGLVSPWDLEPWGRTYGTHSPMYRAYQADGQLLMLGVGYESSTYVHVVETMVWNHRCETDLEAKYQFLDRPALGACWDRAGRLRRGPVGCADCRLFSIRDYVDTLRAEVEGNPTAHLRVSREK